MQKHTQIYGMHMFFVLWNMFRHPSCRRHENPAALAFRGPREGEKKELRNRRAAQLDCSSWMVYCQKPNLSVETGQILRHEIPQKESSGVSSGLMPMYVYYQYIYICIYIYMYIYIYVYIYIHQYDGLTHFESWGLIKHTDFVYQCLSYGKLEDYYVLEKARDDGIPLDGKTPRQPLGWFESFNEHQSAIWWWFFGMFLGNFELRNSGRDSV